MNKKGFSFIIPIAVFIAVFIGALIFGIIYLKLADEILTPFSASLNPISPTASATVDFVHTKITSFWDWVIIVFFLTNIILLFMSAFLIDTHPIFVVAYIISCMFLAMFMSDLLNPVDRIYNSAQFINQSMAMPLTTHLLNNFEIIILGIMILSGVIIYAKIKYFGVNR